MYGGSSYSFTYDRFCNAYSAIYFNVGFLQVPSGVYFSGDFTITAWIYLLAYQSHSRIIDFGSFQSDNVIFSMASSTSSMRAQINNATSHIFITTPPLIQLNTWYHVAFVFKGTVGYIYVNGNLATSGTQYVPRNVSRSSNYIGKSNWINNQNANATYDDLRIYAGALSATQILTEYITSSNNGIYVSVNN